MKRSRVSPPIISPQLANNIDDCGAKESTQNEALSHTQVCPKQCLPKQPRQPTLSRNEPQRRAGILPAPVGNADGTEPLALARSPGRLEACPTLGPLRFMVPMHAQERKEALHEPMWPGARNSFRHRADS